jgi:hypothetical protein
LTHVTRLLVASLVLLLVTATAQANSVFFTYSVSNGEVSISSYEGPGGMVKVPDTIEGYPVTGIGPLAFSYDTRITTIELPDTVRQVGIYAFTGCVNLGAIRLGSDLEEVGDYAFAGCSGLKRVTFSSAVSRLGLLVFNGCSRLLSVYFEGNAPSLGDFAFQGVPLATVYRLPAATGFSSEFGGRSVVIWDPEVVPNDDRYGVDGEGFGFDIISEEPIVVLVEATDAIGTASWVTLAEVEVINGSADFRDPEWEDFAAQFYRLRMPQ